MARILEALRKAKEDRVAVEAPPAPRPFQPELTDSAEIVVEDEEIPYIEVGAADHSIDASPSVLASAANGKRPNPTVRVDAGAGHRAPESPMQRFTQVAFCPLPAETRTRRPAYERFAPEIVAFHHPENSVCEQYRMLLAGIEAQLPERLCKVMLLTGCKPKSGTTTVVLNLAVTCTRRSGIRVAVVDANFVQPALAERLGLNSYPGLREILLGTVAPQRALQESGEKNLQVIAAGDIDIHSVGLLNDSATLRGALQHLRGQFDVVLVDSPSWSGRAEIVALGSLCDAVYVVANSTASDEVHAAELRRGGCQVRGTILTRN